MTDANLLELLNGAAVVPGLIVIALLTRYIVKEAKRRGLHPLNWGRFPPGMNLVLAMFLFVIGVWGEKVSKWAWRAFGAGPFGISLTASLIFFGFLIIIGLLCKIRALTRPDFGNWPWLASAAVTALVIGMLAYL